MYIILDTFLKKNCTIRLKKNHGFSGGGPGWAMPSVVSARTVLNRTALVWNASSSSSRAIFANESTKLQTPVQVWGLTQLPILTLLWILLLLPRLVPHTPFLFSISFSLVMCFVFLLLRYFVDYFHLLDQLLSQTVISVICESDWVC